MTSDEQLLELVAKDGSMNYDQWPGLLDRLLARLEHIVYNDFPTIPAVPPPPPLPLPLPQSSSTLSSSLPTFDLKDEVSLQSSEHSQDSSNQDSIVPPSQLGNRPPVPMFSDDSKISSSPQQDKPTLPAPLVCLLHSVEATIQKEFGQVPPYTIQRLSELLLAPRKHYRTLPAYLRALDKVVSVTSCADMFPLPYLHHQQPILPVESEADPERNFPASANPDPNPNLTSSTILGSDEALGGALLTPIPWLRHVVGTKDNGDSPRGGDYKSNGTREISDMPNGNTNRGPTNGMNNAFTDTIARRADGGVTQGELIRQEQEAEVIPITQSTITMPDADRTRNAPFSDPDERPHIRGPQEIGMEDMGPQPTTPFSRGNGHLELNVAAAVGRETSPRTGERE